MTILIPILGMSTGWVVLNLTRYFSSTHIDTSDRNTILKIRKIKKVQTQLYKIQKSIEKQQKLQANADLLFNELNNLETDFYNSIKKGR